MFFCLKKEKNYKLKKTKDQMQKLVKRYMCSTMFKQKTTNKRTKVKTKKTSYVKYCFYYIYRTFFFKKFSFLHKVFLKNKYVLNTNSKKERLSQHKFLRSFKTEVISQH